VVQTEYSYDELRQVFPAFLPARRPWYRRFAIVRLLLDKHRRRAILDLARADCFTCHAIRADDDYFPTSTATTLVVPPNDLAGRAGMIDGMVDSVDVLRGEMLFMSVDGWGGRIVRPCVPRDVEAQS
jgi:hypothetical protein